MTASEMLDLPTAAASAGVTYRQVDVWVRAGLVRVQQDGSGSGRPRSIHPHEFQVLWRMGVLVGAGMNPARAAQAARLLAAGEPVDLGDGILIVQGVVDA